MEYPPLVKGLTIEEYKSEFKRIYCQGPIITFDGIAVRFREHNFEHAFFESSRRDGTKDFFSPTRAERINWIQSALNDGNAEIFVGYDKKKKTYNKSRRVALVLENYVVIIRLTSELTAQFVTAFLADTTATVDKIRKSPKWT